MAVLRAGVNTGRSSFGCTTIEAEGQLDSASPCEIPYGSIWYKGKSKSKSL